MSSLDMQNNKFVYTNHLESRVLIDFSDYLSNKSRIPLHSSEVTVSKIINNLMKEHDIISAGTLQYDLAEYYLAMDALVTAFLLKRAEAVKVLELGCTNGILSYHLASLLGVFNEKSMLCGVCNAIGNESGNRWLDIVTKVAELPDLSLVVSDYDNTNLQEKSYDIVIINGSERFDAPDKVIQEADRVLAKKGMLICYANQQTLLANAFKLFCPEYEEYSFDAFNKVLVYRM